MPFSFTYDQARAILFTEATGMVTFQEIKDHLEREKDAGALACRELIDAQDATTDLTAAEVRALVGLLKAQMEAGPFGPTAVVTKNDTFFGMIRMLEMLSELQGGPPLAAFRTYDDAMKWLLALSWGKL